MTRVTALECAAVAAMLSIFGCGGTPAPTRPSLSPPGASIGVAGPTQATPVTASWSCFTQRAAGTPGIFAAGVRDAACPAVSRTPLLGSRAAAAGVAQWGVASDVDFSPIVLAGSVSGSTVTLTWTMTRGVAVSYVIEAGSSPGADDLAFFDTGSSAQAFTATSVPAGTYYVRVYPADDTYYYVSGESNEIIMRVNPGSPPSPSTPPNTPTDFAFATSDLGDTVIFNWTAPSGGGLPTSYIIEYGTTPDGYPGVVDTGNSNTSYTVPVSSVPAGLYYLRLRAKNAAGTSDPSNSTIFRSGSAFEFDPTVPKLWTVTVGVPFPSHSFCQPAQAPCMGGDRPGDSPTFGAGPYYFKLGTGVGFPPVGLILSPDGVLSGTPTVKGPKTFKVCAVGLGGDCKCKEVTINVVAATAPPPPTVPPPTPATITANPSSVSLTTGPVSACYPVRCTVTQTITITSHTAWKAYGVDLTAYGSFSVSPESGPTGSTSVTLSYTSFGIGGENGYVRVVSLNSTGSLDVPVIVKTRQ